MDPKVEYNNSTSTNPVNRPGLMPIIAVIVTILVIGAIAGTVIYNNNHSKTNTSGSKSQSNQNSSKNTGPASAAKPSSSSMPANGSTTTHVNGNNQQLTNTGPGDTVAIFVGVVIGGSLIHFVIKRREAIS